jgi:catechol 2,3-dioxygenase-like lactoylglutathione lyase family enzyme
MTRPKNPEFELQGVNHLALVCKDMAKTVEFYRDVLGMPLIKTLDLANGMGQHFFFDIGNGDSLAFFWFPEAPSAQPGVTAPVGLPGGNLPIISAHSSMNHLAINIPASKVEEYHRKLLEKGVKVTPIVNHDESPRGISPEPSPSTFVRSIYFFDPDGICVEFAAWTRELPGPNDVRHAPARAGEKARERIV